MQHNYNYPATFGRYQRIHGCEFSDEIVVEVWIIHSAVTVTIWSAAAAHAHAGTSDGIRSC